MIPCVVVHHQQITTVYAFVLSYVQYHTMNPKYYILRRISNTHFELIRANTNRSIFRQMVKIKNRRQLTRDVYSVVQRPIVEQMQKYIKTRVNTTLYTKTKLRNILLGFLHYNIKLKDTFQSLEEMFNLQHSNFNHDYFVLLSILDRWAATKFTAGLLADRRQAAKDGIAYRKLQHTTLLCDSKVFKEQRRRGLNKKSKWWWGKNRCGGIKVVAFTSHDMKFRHVMGPFGPYEYDGSIVCAARREIQKKFDKRDVVMADHHFDKCKSWKNVQWELKKRDTKTHPASGADKIFNQHHKAIGLAHLESCWGSVVQLFPKLQTKIPLYPKQHYKLVRIACAIHNLKKNK